MQDLKPTPHAVDRFVVKSGGRVFFVRAEEIDWVEAAGNYVKLHVGTETHLLRETMNAIESQLDPEHVLPHPPLATSSTSSACGNSSRRSTASTWSS